MCAGAFIYIHTSLKLVEASVCSNIQAVEEKLSWCGNL